MSDVPPMVARQALLSTLGLIAGGACILTGLVLQITIGEAAGAAVAELMMHGVWMTAICLAARVMWDWVGVTPGRVLWIQLTKVFGLLGAGLGIGNSALLVVFYRDQIAAWVIALAVAVTVLSAGLTLAALWPWAKRPDRGISDARPSDDVSPLEAHRMARQALLSTLGLIAGGVCIVMGLVLQLVIGKANQISPVLLFTGGCTAVVCSAARMRWGWARMTRRRRVWVFILEFLSILGFIKCFTDGLLMLEILDDVRGATTWVVILAAVMVMVSAGLMLLAPIPLPWRTPPSLRQSHRS